MNENGFNQDRVTKVRPSLHSYKFLNNIDLDAFQLLQQPFIGNWYMCFLQAVEKIKAAKNKSSQGR